MASITTVENLLERCKSFKDKYLVRPTHWLDKNKFSIFEIQPDGKSIKVWKSKQDCEILHLSDTVEYVILKKASVGVILWLNKRLKGSLSHIYIRKDHWTSFHSIKEVVFDGKKRVGVVVERFSRPDVVKMKETVSYVIKS